MIFRHESWICVVCFDIHSVVTGAFELGSVFECIQILSFQLIGRALRSSDGIHKYYFHIARLGDIDPCSISIIFILCGFFFSCRVQVQPIYSAIIRQFF